MDSKNRQREHRNSLKLKGYKTLTIPLYEPDILKAVEITNAENVREAVKQIFLKGLEVQEPAPTAADAPPTPPPELEKLIDTIREETKTLAAEIEKCEATGKNWRKNQQILAKQQLLEKLEKFLPPTD